MHFLFTAVDMPTSTTSMMEVDVESLSNASTSSAGNGGSTGNGGSADNGVGLALARKGQDNSRQRQGKRPKGAETAAPAPSTASVSITSQAKPVLRSFWQRAMAATGTMGEALDKIPLETIESEAMETEGSKETLEENSGQKHQLSSLQLAALQQAPTSSTEQLTFDDESLDVKAAAWKYREGVPDPDSDDSFYNY